MLVMNVSRDKILSDVHTNPSQKMFISISMCGLGWGFIAGGKGDVEFQG